jgi:UDP-glucose 4-epimerase
LNILVAGGAGYIGSVTVEELIKAGEKVIVFDRLSTGHHEAIHPLAEFIQGDLLDKGAIDRVFETHQIDAVMHFASHIQAGESMQKPFIYLGENYNVGSNLIQSTVEHGIKRFILSSTAALYGVPEHLPITEEEQINPGNPYGEAKFFLERILSWMEKIYTLRYTALRYFNAAGASGERGEDHHPETHLIPIVLEAAMGKRPQLPLFGVDYPTRDGTCIRDYIHVVDLAQAHILALRALDDTSHIYNLGNGQGYTNKEVIEVAREVTGRAINVEIHPRRPGDPASLIASSEKIRRELGWQPQYPSLKAIISTAWEWHLAHPDGYAR